MNALCFFLLCGLLSRTCAGQSLIANGGFEQQHACPQYVGDIEFARGWRNANDNTPDLFSRCTGDRANGLNVPANYMGTRQPVNGDAYAGLALFHDRRRGESFRHNYAQEEAIWTALTAPLQPGRTYQLRVWVSVADSAEYFAPYLTALFSPTAFNAVRGTEPGQALRLPLAPRARDRAWHEVVVSWQPTGRWQYLALGLSRSVFTPREYQQALLRQQTGLSRRGERTCYYYIDDITLVQVK